MLQESLTNAITSHHVMYCDNSTVLFLLILFLRYIRVRNIAHTMNKKQCLTTRNTRMIRDTIENASTTSAIQEEGLENLASNTPT